MLGSKGLLNVAAKTIEEWVGGKRKEFDRKGSVTGSSPLDNVSNIASAPPKLGDLSRCACCGVERENLRKCSRCKQASYCSRGKFEDFA